MTLNEAIEYYDSLAEECRRKASIERNDYMDLRDESAEYSQLSEWLAELAVLREKVNYSELPNNSQTKFKPGDRFLLEIGEKCIGLDEYSIVGTDQYVWGSLLEKLTLYEPTGDTISRQAVLDLYSDLYWGDERLLAFRKELDAVFDKIRALPSVQAEQKWIPCSERMPKENVDILVTYVDGEETRIIPVNYGRDTWFDCIFNAALDPLKITAWMPLPEPYRGDTDE